MHDILSELEQLKADYASAQASLEEAKASKAALDTLLAEKDEDISKARKAVSEAQAAVADKDMALATIQAQLEELKASAKTAEQKAVDMVASQGIAPVKVEQKQAPMTKADIVAKLQTIKDPQERGAFYEANRSTLFDK